MTINAGRFNSSIPKVTCLEAAKFLNVEVFLVPQVQKQLKTILSLRTYHRTEERGLTVCSIKTPVDWQIK